VELDRSDWDPHSEDRSPRWLGLTALLAAIGYAVALGLAMYTIVRIAGLLHFVVVD
jgi:hypothetical protein